MTTILPLLIAPFIIQAGMTFFDEFYYHHKRGLPLWERLGHPLDTITVLVCYAFIMTQDPTHSNLLTYIALAVFSCVFITKDEFVHHENSCATEQWLHSMLFVIHPIGLTTLLAFWYAPSFPKIITAADVALFQDFIKVQFIIVSLFLTYQILYWSIPWKKLIQTRSKSTTNTTTP